MSHAEFAASPICVEQKEVTRLLVMRPMERQKFVRGVMGVDVLDDAVAAARKAKNELNQELAGFRAAMPDGEGLEAAVTLARDAWRKAVSEKAACETKIAGADGALEVARGHLAVSKQRKREWESLDRTASDVHERLRACLDRTRIVEAELDGVKEAERELARVRENIEDLKGVEQRCEKHEEARRVSDDRTRWQEERDRLTKEVHELTDELKGMRDRSEGVCWGDVETSERRLAKVQVRLSELKGDRQASAKAATIHANNFETVIRRTKKALGDGNCPTCGRELENREALEAELAKAQERFDENRERAIALEAPSTAEIELADEYAARERELLDVRIAHEREIEGRTLILACQDKRDRARAQILEHQRHIDASLNTPPYDSAEHEQDKRLLTQYHSAIGRVAVLAKTVQRAPDLKRMSAELITEKHDHERQLAHLSQKLVELGFIHAHHETLKDEFRDAEARSTTLHVELTDLRMEERLKKVGHDNAEKDLASFRDQQSRERDMANKLAVETSVADRLNTFRAAVLGSIRPEVEELMSGFVDLLSDGRHETASLDDTFGVLLHEDGLESPVISGGTEDITALALRLAISQMIAERTGATLNTIILDEPFGSLDATRRANVLALLRRLGGIFSQVILISHIAETREAVDRVVELSYDESKGHTRVLS